MYSACVGKVQECHFALICISLHVWSQEIHLLKRTGSVMFPAYRNVAQSYGVYCVYIEDLCRKCDMHTGNIPSHIACTEYRISTANVMI